MQHHPRRRGEELLKRCCALDSVKPAVNLEDPVLAAALFSLFHGNSGETTLDSSVPADRRRAPAGPGLRSRLVGLMCRSVAAANRFPAVVQVRGSREPPWLWTTLARVRAHERWTKLVSVGRGARAMDHARVG